ncbi:endonuclease/exonuclease/phosphatase family protein [Micrococcus porci]|uniref:endonuclease/exonuclease/phosphatase family protein n=1 Tax=Micrococcus TaxID=1269 RepID=UPI001CCCEE6A|nr:MULTISPECIES: endonuclease/exonuclease/phosphatase family protein [Micrococcus]MCG7423390.1 endonuclease/exonuclease/phosphatase family protein [Micrococcus sp. ACRRV]UBH24631.1 endonuclease/exonuclease/phosphatase family protein [Micrococcus porci]
MRLRHLSAAMAAAALAASGAAVAHAAPSAHVSASPGARATAVADAHDVRVATYNASLNRGTEGELVRDLTTPDDQQAKNIAEVIQTARPEILLVNEFDHDAAGEGARLFQENYLSVGQNGHAPIEYRYRYTAPVNTGVPSGLDLDQNGTVGGPNDAWGFGLFPGQYGMVIYSQHPILEDRIRTFQDFRWADMPGNVMPEGYYTAKQERQLRLSSKSHWDVPVRIGGTSVHILAAHPTPPSFDGPEKRNQRRNHDEIRLWADYITGGKTAEYLYDDAGVHGGLPRGERFVILGDYNADPLDGDSWDGAIDQLLQNRRVRDPQPRSAGAAEASVLQGGANRTHRGDPSLDTADFNDVPAPGNLRVDMALPSRNLPLRGAGVFWPKQGEPGSELTGTYPFPTSDHRLTWVDVKVPGGR